MSRAVMVWIAILFVFAGSMLVLMTKRASDRERFGSAQTVDPEFTEKRPQLTEFELIDQTGASLNSKDLKGQVWAASFFFSTCPSTCFNQNVRLQQLQSKYAPRGLQMLSITCDPANDSAAVLARYAARFNADARNWRFLTPLDASQEYVTQIGNDFFQLVVGPETHSDRVVVFDSDGNQVGAYSVLNAEQYQQLDEALDRILPEESEAS